MLPLNNKAKIVFYVNAIFYDRVFNVILVFTTYFSSILPDTHSFSLLINISTTTHDVTKMPITFLRPDYSDDELNTQFRDEKSIRFM